MLSVLVEHFEWEEMWYGLIGDEVGLCVWLVCVVMFEWLNGVLGCCYCGVVVGDLCVVVFVWFGVLYGGCEVCGDGYLRGNWWRCGCGWVWWVEKGCVDVLDWVHYR